VCTPFVYSVCMNSFSSIINQWKNNSELAQDVAQEFPNITSNHVNQWRERDNVPSPYWKTVVKSARKRSIKNVSLDALAEIARSKKIRATAAE